MKVFINESEIDKHLVGVNTGMNFGRFNFEGIITDHFKIQLSIQEFIKYIELDYNDIRDEIKIDDQLQNESSQFSKIDYGSITKLLQSENHTLYAIVTTFLDKILYNKLFSKSTNPFYMINSTGRVSVHNNCIEFYGKSYQKKKL